MIAADAIQQDRASREQRRQESRWLNQQAEPRESLPVQILTVAESLAHIAFLVLLAHALVQIALGELQNAGTSAFWPMLSALALLACLRAGLRSVADHRAAIQSERISQRLYRQALKTAMDPARRLALGRSDADLGADVSESMADISPWYREYRPARLQAMVQPAVILAITFYLDWLAGLLLLLAAPLIPLFSALIGLGTASLAEAQQETLRRLGHQFLDRVRALPTLRLASQTENQGQAVGQSAERYRESSMQVLRIAFLSSAVLEFFSAIAIASLAVYVGLALLGYIEFGPATALSFHAGLSILLLAPDFFQPLRRLAAGYHQRAAALAAAPRVRGLVEMAAESASDRIQQPRNPAPLSLALDEAEIAWPNAPRPLFQSLSLNVQAGEWLAIQGPSGSGKSTLAACLMGWLPPRGGTLSLGKKPLAQWTKGEHKSAIAWLGQQPHLLPTSLRRNLDPGLHHEENRLRQVLAQLGLASLPAQLAGGLDHVLGERGAGISGGEAQRIALGRALLSGAGLIILDEPTASLDPDNAEAILSQLERLAGSITLVMFSHDPRAAEHAHRRLWLENGRLRHAD
ncbi:ATP-binding cassette subfamily C protein CydD [Natronospira proteinivora]|uniref:ATP-binding cassette subfamily C protein CydD n=1 Tax=Natronospira proteinivora TaxID=1807133 RepID=A0ABT1G5Z7_9GAMM|nr:thiol reductant ABC exporter subunit CydD [Natronospira proteinivora]MCP1726507.1 ATP-binding cassette subfamily C protein CydD [Natronospira proteinivora]